jgi:hypothetical protein
MVLANRKSASVNSFMRKCQMKLFERPKTSQDPFVSTCRTQARKYGFKEEFLTILVPWIPLRVWRNLRNPSQKKVLKCIKYNLCHIYNTKKTNYAETDFTNY